MLKQRCYVVTLKQRIKMSEQLVIDRIINRITDVSKHVFIK